MFHMRHKHHSIHKTYLALKRAYPFIDMDVSIELACNQYFKAFYETEEKDPG